MSNYYCQIFTYRAVSVCDCKRRCQIVIISKQNIGSTASSSCCHALGYLQHIIWNKKDCRDGIKPCPAINRFMRHQYTSSSVPMDYHLTLIFRAGAAFSDVRDKCTSAKVLCTMYVIVCLFNKSAWLAAMRPQLQNLNWSEHKCVELKLLKHEPRVWVYPWSKEVALEGMKHPRVNNRSGNPKYLMFVRRLRVSSVCICFVSEEIVFVDDGHKSLKIVCQFHCEIYIEMFMICLLYAALYYIY